MQISRLFEIVYLLLSENIVTAKELAERFGVSQRTIYRDIDTLGLAGIPVYTERGKGGGISLLPDFVLNKSILSEQEQNEILTALKGLSGVKTGETDPVLQKMSAVFKKDVINWLEVDFSDWGYEYGGEFYDFKKAILERRIVEFDYYNSYMEFDRRQIEPIQLWFKSRAWYVKGYCLLRRDLRTFKMSRVRNLTVTEKHFEQRDFLAGQKNAVTSEQAGKNVTLQLRIAPEMAYRVLDEFGCCVTERQSDGSFIVSVTWPESEWIYGAIMSYGEYIEVIEPEHIREIIRGKAKKMLKNFS